MEKRKAKGILALLGRLKEMEFSDEVIQKKQKQMISHFLQLVGIREKEETGLWIMILIWPQMKLSLLIR